MQTQWSKSNIRSETKDTPLRSLGGNSSHYLREVILTGGVFKPISKLVAAGVCLGHDQSPDSASVYRGSPQSSGQQPPNVGLG